MYNKYDFIEFLNESMANNKLFCTFALSSNLDSVTEDIIQAYTILFNKVFILEVKDSNEYAITYNIEVTNMNGIPSNTISVHRKKESNTLYTINSLNILIKSLNGGKTDHGFQVPWQDYRNSILLTQNDQFKQLNTKVHKIIDVG